MMKKYIFCFYILVLTISLASCGQAKKGEAEKEKTMIPGEIAALIMGDSFRADTLYSSEEGSYVHIVNPDYLQHIVYGPEGLLINSPTATLDSLGKGYYAVKDVFGTITVDFAIPSSIEDLKAAYPQYVGFSQINVYGDNISGQKAVYSYSVAVARKNIKNSDAINRWLKTCVDDSVKGDPTIKQMGETMMNNFFGLYKKAETQWQYTDSRSILVYEKTDKYLTYEDYFYGFRGGAHGMYAIRFVSYDLEKNAPVTYSSLFKDDCEEQVRELIFESIAADDDYMSGHKLTSLSQVKSYVNNNLGGVLLPIPQPALLNSGIVFCYQPYDIGPYADGALQVVVPYDRANDLLR